MKQKPPQSPSSYRGTKKRVEEECITKKKREEEEGRERERLKRPNTPPFGRTCQQWRKVCDREYRLPAA